MAGGQMMLRCVARRGQLLGKAGVLEAVKGFRRLKGCTDMPRLVAALRARDQRLGLGALVAKRVESHPAAAEFQQRSGHPQGRVNT